MNDLLMRDRSIYRPEIDGLRAVAVLCVLFYHAGFSWMPGGFVGVDVFFVISGYLITRKIVSEHEKSGAFSFWDFYKGRIIRLLPALYVTLACSFATAYVILPPELMASFARSVIATVGSFSNVLFRAESGYFDAANIQKPLLHTWSLSVEEQFYLFWPILLILAARRGRRFSAPALVATVGVVSFVLSVIFINHEAAIYYLLPFRAFELAIGAALVWRHRLGSTSALWNESLVVAGLGAIMLSALFYNDKTVFPSYNALLPCMGAAAIIVSNGSLIGRLVLANTASVWVGLISYSLYLVHWPIIVFFTFRHIGPLAVSDKIMLSVASLIAAGALYLLVERPIQNKNRRDVSRVKVALITVCAACVLVVPALSAWQSRGWLWRYPPDVARLLDTSRAKEGVTAYPKLCFMDPAKGGDIDSGCYAIKPNGKKNILVLGDSSSYHLLDGLYTLLRDEANIYAWSGSTCPAVRNIPAGYWNPICKQKMDEFFASVLPNNRYDLVLISQIGNHELVRDGIAASFAEFQKYNVPAVLLGESPSYESPVADLVARNQTSDGLAEFMKKNLRGGCSSDLVLREAVPNGHFFPMNDVLCKEGYPVFDVDGRLINADHLHFNGYGSLFVARHLVDWLRQQDFLPRR